jgi:hypothetical protein
MVKTGQTFTDAVTSVNTSRSAHSDGGYRTPCEPGRHLGKSRCDRRQADQGPARDRPVRLPWLTAAADGGNRAVYVIKT